MFLPKNLHIAYLEVLETYENALLRKRKREGGGGRGQISNQNALYYGLIFLSEMKGQLCHSKTSTQHIQRYQKHMAILFFVGKKFSNFKRKFCYRSRFSSKIIDQCSTREPAHCIFRGPRNIWQCSLVKKCLSNLV